MYDDQDAPLNPYAPPGAEDIQAAPSDDLARAEAIRREHIKHEASIKSVGCLHIFGGALMLLAGLGAIFGAAMSGGRGGGSEMFIVAVVYLGIGSLSFASGYGLRTLKPWSRILSSILCAIGLIGFPIGTLLNAYFLYLILSAKGQTILSEEYKYVVTATPHVKYTSWVAIILLILLLVGGVALVGLSMSRAI
jgi:hypothetical protein